MQSEKDKLPLEKRVVWTPGMTIEEVHKEVVKNALDFLDWNMVHTAHDLGISIRTLRNWCNKWFPERKSRTRFHHYKRIIKQRENPGVASMCERYPDY